MKKENIIYAAIGIILLLLVVSQLPIIPQFSIVLTEEEKEENLYEYYDEGDLGELSFYSGAIVGNVFTIGTVGPNENFVINSIKIKLKKQGSPGTIYLNIYKSGVDGKPTGEPLTSGSIQGNDLSETEFEELTIDLEKAILNKDEKYVFFLSITGGDENNMVWTRAFNDNLYPGGDAILKVEEGWQYYDYFDVLFKIYGTGPV